MAGTDGLPNASFAGLIYIPSSPSFTTIICIFPRERRCFSSPLSCTHDIHEDGFRFQDRKGWLIHIYFAFLCMWRRKWGHFSELAGRSPKARSSFMVYEYIIDFTRHL